MLKADVQDIANKLLSNYYRKSISKNQANNFVNCILELQV